MGRYSRGVERRKHLLAAKAIFNRLNHDGVLDSELEFLKVEEARDVPSGASDGPSSTEIASSREDAAKPLNARNRLDRRQDFLLLQLDEDKNDKGDGSGTNANAGEHDGGKERRFLKPNLYINTDAEATETPQISIQRPSGSPMLLAPPSRSKELGFRPATGMRVQDRSLLASPAAASAIPSPSTYNAAPSPKSYRPSTAVRETVEWSRRTLQATKKRLEHDHLLPSSASNGPVGESEGVLKRRAHLKRALDEAERKVTALETQHHHPQSTFVSGEEFQPPPTVNTMERGIIAAFDDVFVQTKALLSLSKAEQAAPCSSEETLRPSMTHLPSPMHQRWMK